MQALDALAFGKKTRTVHAPAFTGATAFEVAVQHVQKEPPPLTALTAC